MLTKLTGSCRKGGMKETTKAGSRKEYQRVWMAKKRAALRASRGMEEIRLTVPKALAAALRAKKPKGVALRQWLPVFLRESLRGADSIKPDRAVSQPRNALCSCGSGKKFKACCGKPV